MNVGKLATGRPYMTPCTPLAVIALLEHYNIPVAGQRVAMVGRSMVVGTPLSVLFARKHATVTVCHTGTKDLPEILGLSDIVVVAIGSPAHVRGSWLRPGSVVIDVGINRMDTGAAETKQSLVGDVDFGSAAEVVGAISPVPGGVGPLTVAMLARNLWEAYQTQTAGMAIDIDHANQAKCGE